MFRGKLVKSNPAGPGVGRGASQLFESSRTLSRILFYCLNIFLFFILLLMIAKPHFGSRYKYQIGDISQEDIISSRNITYINERETEKRIQEVMGRVPPVFDLRLWIADDITLKVRNFFSIIEGKEGENGIIDRVYLSIEKKLDRHMIRYLLLNHTKKHYMEKLNATIHYLSSRGVSSSKREELNGYEKTGILLKKFGAAEISHEKVEIDMIVAADEIEREVEVFLRERYEELNTTDITVLKALALHFLKPDLFLNREESRQLLDEEIKKVEPVLNTIKKGAVVIRRGEEIDEENFPKLRAIMTYTSHFNIKAITGIGILLGILMFISMIIFIEEGTKEEVQRYFIFASLTLFSIAYAYLITLIKNRPEHIFLGVLIPTAGITMTSEILYNRKFSLSIAIIIPILLLLISGNDPYTFFFSMGSGLVGLYVVKDAEKRSDLLRAGVFIIIANELFLISSALLKELKLKNLFMLLTWGIGNGIVSVVFTLGVIPFFEVLLNIPTNFRLLELSDLSAPMMKKMQIEAPGTYYHSINVANMAENAARAIKANALLVRVSALYHDIGKIPNAEYYIENIKGVSKHSFLKPSLSNSILKAHVKMGVEMAKEMKLPEEVVDIIAQHHGTSLIKYFYHQALKTHKGNDEIDEMDYHYPGPKPQNREAAIVMLADAVEAASRVLKDPSASRIEEFINEIIEGKFREGQLNESPLTLRGLMKISVAFRRYLMGVFHSRIDYPDEKELEKSSSNGEREKRERI